MTEKRRREIYNHGIPGKKWGIWNSMRKKFQFGICEDTLRKAENALFKAIGTKSYKWRFSAKILPDELVEKYSKGRRSENAV